MKAFMLESIADLSAISEPLSMVDMPIPIPGPRDILVRVSCCGVCHTELDEIEGRTPPTRWPVIPGHQVVGRVEKTGASATRFKAGDRVGVAWIFSACGHCALCRGGQENLCEEFKATGRDAHGGYAEYMAVDERYAYSIPSGLTDVQAAPLLCAGAIGFRSVKLCGLNQGQSLGLTGFGASGHLVLKMVRHLFPSMPILVFARSREEQAFARSLGAVWAGGIKDEPPHLLDAIIDTTPRWEPVLQSLLRLSPGGRLVINAIRKESDDLDAWLQVRYQDHLWLEKEIKSVANITRKDVEEFLHLAGEVPIKPEVEIYPFEQANLALLDLKKKHVKGAKVLQIRQVVPK